MKAVVLILMLVTSSAQGIVIRHDRSDNEYKVPSNTLPALATFYVDGAHGVLIEPKWVLTAAHTTFCVTADASIMINNTLVDVEQVYVHSQYTPGVSHDIALVKLRQPVHGVTPFAVNNKPNEVGEALWFIGVGGTGNGNTGQTIDNWDNQGQMRQAQNAVTAASGPLLSFVFDQGDKALPLEGVSGGGDSGGPAYRFEDGQGVVYGVSSRASGRGIGVYGVTEIYSRASYFHPWITRIIANQEVEAVSLPALPSLPAGLNQDNLAQVCDDIGLTRDDS